MYNFRMCRELNVDRVTKQEQHTSSYVYLELKSQ